MPEKFDRDNSVEIRVAGLVDGAHATFANLGEDLEIRDAAG